MSFGSEVDGIALDGAGNLFISDHLNNRIIVITPGGVASALTINGLATALGHPTGLAFDAAGNLYISDYSNGRVVEVSMPLSRRDDFPGLRDSDRDERLHHHFTGHYRGGG